MTAIIEDTYAEAFRSIYAEVLVTARDEKWLNHACYAATGHASSTIMCDCEAGIAHRLSSDETPDGRIGAILQFHVPRFRKDRREALERALLSRVSQNILTCPTTACFQIGAPEKDYFRLGRKVAYFGDGYEKLETRHGRKMWVIPTMGGEFCIERRFGFHDGIMGGNLWFLGVSENAAITAAERAAESVDEMPGVVTTFPGGVAASASKAGSQYSFLFASTYHNYCPTLRQQLGDDCQVPPGVNSIMEIIINGHDLDVVAQATYRAIEACVDTPGLARVSAGNYGGRLGKSFIHLRESNLKRGEDGSNPAKPVAIS